MIHGDVSARARAVRSAMLALIAGLAWAPGACGNNLAFTTARSPAIHGLVAMGSLRWMRTGTPPPNALEEPLAHPGLYKAAVCDLRWSDLEPTQAGPLQTRSLDACLARISQYNRDHRATPMGAKLRVYGGEFAPAWTKNLEGSPVDLLVGGSAEKGAFTIGHWWSSRYRAAWADMQARLAKAYNANPLVLEVAVTGCSVRTAEPFIVPAGPVGRRVLPAAGYNDNLEIACLRDWPLAYKYWTRPALDYTFSPFMPLNGSPGSVDNGKVRAVMGEFRALVGPGAVISNHGLQQPIPPRNIGVYTGLAHFGAPVAFQFVNQQQQTDAAFALGKSYGMTELEVFDSRAAGGFANTDATQLKAWSAALGGY